MITIKKSGLRALTITLFTLLIISSLAIIVKAMNSNSEVKVVDKTTVTTTTWYFTGTSISEVFTASKWQDTDPMNTSCTVDNEPLPCVYSVNDTDIINAEALVQYLEDKHEEDAAQVALASIYRKPE